jgi:hypothetical protein
VDEFSLSFEWARILFSYQYHLTKREIQAEPDIRKRILKQRWLDDWTKYIETFLHTQFQKEDSSEKECSLVTDFESLKKKVRELRANSTEDDKNNPYFVLLELSLFVPYYPLGSEEDQEFQTLGLCDSFQKRLLGFLELCAESLGVMMYYVTIFKKRYEKLIDELRERNSQSLLHILGGLMGAVVLAVTAAFALPLVVGVLAPFLAPGLSGAAAFSAVLAALGGGAIAAGGFGMAGGVAVIVGGGAILGATVGSSISGIGAAFVQSPELVISQAAKFLVAFDKIILMGKKPEEEVVRAKELIQRIRQTIHLYEDKIFELGLNAQEHQNEIKNCNQVVHLLKKVVEIAQRILWDFMNRYGLA